MDNNKKKFLKSLSEANGIISTACNNSGIVRQTFYNWRKDDPVFAQEVEDVIEEAIDHVESKLMEKINGVEVETINSKGESSVYSLPPSDTAIIFFLKCKAKKRGYVERQEVVPMDPDGNALQPIININVVNPVKEDDATGL